MEMKTTVEAESGRQELFIRREFDIPVDLLYMAYTESKFVEQWMGTRVLKLENRKHGSYHFETSDANGNVVFSAQGVFHDVVQNRSITRTFQMMNTSFEAQLELLEFEEISDEKSLLKMQIVFRSVDLRDQLLKLPFAMGINMAHQKLEQVIKSKDLRK